MKQVALIALLCLKLTTLLSYSYYSPINKKELIKKNYNDSTYSLNYSPIIEYSETVFTDTLTLIRNDDYKINYSKGIITFFNKKKENYQITYKTLPKKIFRKYYLFEEIELKDSTKIKNVLKKRRKFNSRNNLDITGNKKISISVSNSEEVSIDQSLFLRINGELSNNLNVQAQLSDSQSPITSQGSSKEITNLDEIYIKVFGKQYEIAFGNLSMELNNNKFLKYMPEFEGMRITWQNSNHLFQGALALTKSKKETVNFNGVDGKLGPYYLKLNDQRENIQIVSGSETVYLNGIPQQRGEQYKIDYSEGSITFINQDINSNSFIMVDFQYSDENYRKNLYLAKSKNSLMESIQINQAIIYQSDDKNNPLTAAISDTDKSILQNSGDSIAWNNGITEVDIGEGNYIKMSEGHYVYTGLDSTGNYLLNFTYVGNFKGDYERLSYYEYAYVGESNGDYIIGEIIPSPQSTMNYDLNTIFSFHDFKLRFEGLFSSHDLNTFSSKDDNDNNGVALLSKMEYNPDFDKIKPLVSVEQSFYSQNLHTISESKVAEESSNLNKIDIPDSTKRTEFNTNLRTNFFNINRISLNYKLKKADKVAQVENLTISNNLKQKFIFPQLDARLITSKAKYYENNDQDLLNYYLRTRYGIKAISAGYTYDTEKYTISRTDTTKTGTQTVKNKLELAYDDNSNLFSSIFYEVNRENRLIASWQKYKKTTTKGINSLFNNLKHKIDLSYSQTNITGYEEEVDGEDFDRLNISTTHNLFKNGARIDFEYEISNLEHYPKIKELQYVGEENGIYDSTGVYDEDGEWDWVYVTLDEAQMTIDVNLDLSLAFNPNYFDIFKNTPLDKFQSQTDILITENSSSDKRWRVYLLDSENTMNDSTTIYGKQRLRQNLWYDLIKRKVLLNYELNYNKTLDNQYQEREIRKRNYHKGAVSLFLLKKTDLEVIYENGTEKNSYYESLTKTQRLSLDINHKFHRNLIYRMNSNFNQEDTKNFENQNAYSIKSFGIENYLTFFFKSKYRIYSNLSYKYNKREGSNFLNYLDEKKKGSIYKWFLKINYKISNIFSLNMNYSGKSYPQQTSEHKFRMELSAEF